MERLRRLEEIDNRSNYDDLSNEEINRRIDNYECGFIYDRDNRQRIIRLLNKLENGELLPQFKRFNVSESLTEQILEFIPLIEAKDIHLECSVEPDIFIQSEQSYLELVWSNLISNAIKFTENESTIRIQLKSLYEKLIFTIEDTGCGMQEETGKRFFDKFYQGDTSHSKEGNGLGLALVKRVIDILGGEITVESELGKGTKFQVSIRKDGYGR